MYTGISRLLHYNDWTWIETALVGLPLAGLCYGLYMIWMISSEHHAEVNDEHYHSGTPDAEDYLFLETHLLSSGYSARVHPVDLPDSDVGGAGDGASSGTGSAGKTGTFGNTGTLGNTGTGGDTKLDALATATRGQVQPSIHAVRGTAIPSPSEGGGPSPTPSPMSRQLRTELKTELKLVRNGKRKSRGRTMIKRIQSISAY